MTYQNVFRGVLAGLLATTVLSFLMLSKGVIPQLEPLTLLIGIARAVVARTVFLPAPLAGWIWFFVIGTLWWGALFAVMEPILPGRSLWTKGATFGLGAGFLMIWTIMPLAAAGALGMQLSLMQPVITLLEHVIYGAVLGAVYSRLKVP